MICGYPLCVPLWVLLVTVPTQLSHGTHKHFRTTRKKDLWVLFDVQYRLVPSQPGSAIPRGLYVEVVLGNIAKHNVYSFRGCGRQVVGTF